MSERRRGAVLEAALLDAAWDELLENGYAAFTLDAVVQRAGTSRPVLYRRWPDRGALVRATIAHVADRYRLDAADTGSLRGDVLALMRKINSTKPQFVTVMSIHLAAYYQETGTSPADLRNLLPGDRESVIDIVFARALDRGEITPGQVSDRIKALPFDLMRHELLLTLAPLPDEVLEEIVDTVFLPLVRSGGAVPDGRDSIAPERSAPSE